MSIDRNAILAGAGKFKTEPVDVPEWGGTVYVRGLTGAQRDSLELDFLPAKDGKHRAVNVRGRVAAWCVCDENGKRVFADRDADALGQYPAEVLDKINSVAMRLSGMSPEAIGEAEKNSGAGKNDCGGSALPAISG